MIQRVLEQPVLLTVAQAAVSVFVTALIQGAVSLYRKL